MTTGELIKTARIKAGLTQAQLADRLGIPYQSIGQWERNIRHPKLKTIERIAAALDVPLSSLLDPEVQGFSNSKLFEAARKLAISMAQEGNADELAITHSSDGSERYEIRSSQATRLLDAFDRLNKDGREKAVERVEELAEIPRYLVAPEEGDSEHE